MAKQISSTTKHISGRHKRPGVIAKTKVSRLKQSKHYKKAYRGQGRC